MKYEAGRKYRVIKAGARLCGFKPIAPWAQQGWSRELKVGDVITCRGESWTMGDGVPALKWGDENGEWLANDCLFEPAKGSMWEGQRPQDGFLEEA